MTGSLELLLLSFGDHVIHGGLNFRVGEIYTTTLRRHVAGGSRIARERVLFLPYEMLHRSRDVFVERVCAFSNAKVPAELPDARPNPGLSPLSIALKRPLNRLFVADRLNPAPLLASAGANARLSRVFSQLDAFLPHVLTGGGGKPGRLERTIDRFVGDRYRQSNHRTADLIGVDLAKYGYPL